MGVKSFNNWLKNIEYSLNEYNHIKKLLGNSLLILLLSAIVALFYYVAIDFDFLAKFLFQDQNSVNGDLLKTVLTAIGGIAVFYGLILNSRRIKQQTDQNNINREINADERFREAISFLKDTDKTIILGGIYALNQLAKEDERYRSIVANLLCAYLRNNSYRLNKEYKEEVDKMVGDVILQEPDLTIQTKAPIVIQSMIDVLFNEAKPIFAELDLDLSGVEFKYVKFTKIVRNANFNYSRLSYCEYLNGIENCSFIQSKINSCSFIGSLNKGRFNDSTIESTSFGFGSFELVESSFYYATINHSNFSFNSILNVDFKATRINDTNFAINTISKSHFFIIEGYGVKFIAIEFGDVKLNFLPRNQNPFLFDGVCKNIPQAEVQNVFFA